METLKKQASRINYANQKHHIQQLRQQIDPKVIERIEVDSNPSLNYKNAFKTVYFDELEKTMKFQEDKRAREKNNTQMSPNSRIEETPIYRNSSIPSLNKSFLPLDEGKNNPVLGTRVQAKSIFIDYDFERKKKFEQLIEGGYDGGKSFFNAQEEYQRRKQQQSKIMKNALLQQIQLKQNKKILQYITHNQETQVFKQNRNKQVQEELTKAKRQRIQHVQIGQQVKLQAQNERIRRHRKSYFELNCVGRHNPITNPIEYHIDNPYILQKYANKVQNEPNNREETNKSTTNYNRAYHNDFIR